MKKIFVPALIISALALSSCATVFCGSKAKITFDSNIDERATLYVDGRKYTSVTFPYTIKIPRGFDETIVKAEADGYESQTIYVDKKFNPISIINLFNILAWGIDGATGAMTKPDYKYYNIDFVRKPNYVQTQE